MKKRNRCIFGMSYNLSAVLCTSTEKQQTKRKSVVFLIGRYSVGFFDRNWKKVKIALKNSNTPFPREPSNLSKSMKDVNKMSVLVEFRSYLRLLTAYDSVNFHQNNWRDNLFSVFYAFCTTLMIVCLAMFIALGIWHLVENGTDLDMFAASFPILMGVLEMEITFIALVWKNRTITETINRLQEVIDKRE